MSSKIGGRSRIEGAVPARRTEGQDTTPKPVSVEHCFAGGEPELVEEDLAGGEPGPSVEDFHSDPEQDTAGGLDHQVKICQFEEFISRLSMAERLRALGLPDVHAVGPLAKMPTIQSAVGLSRGSPGSGALTTGNFRSAEGENSLHAAPRNFSNLGRVEYHAPPVITREEQIAREM